jgi:hypothetical protein
MKPPEQQYQQTIVHLNQKLSIRVAIREEPRLLIPTRDFRAMKPPEQQYQQAILHRSKTLSIRVAIREEQRLLIPS